MSAERFAHVVTQDAAGQNAALTDGTPVTAVCGKVWVPSRDPDAFDACPACIEHLRRAWMA